MKNLELKPSDILTVDGEVMQIDTITSQLASIEDVGGQYKGSIIIKFYDKNGEFHDINSDENRILMYTEDLVMSTWRTLEVSYKVRKNINAYFKKMLPNYEIISVARQSNLPQDAHLYMISAVQKKTGEYAKSIFPCHLKPIIFLFCFNISTTRHSCTHYVASKKMSVFTLSNTFGINPYLM